VIGDVDKRLARLEDEIFELRRSLLVAVEVLIQLTTRCVVPPQPVDLMEPPAHENG
jgi:hypothetical protein